MSFTLTLKNFKCFSNYSVNILSQSIILFDGPSGIGKSSLIQAFVFAVTGDGKKLYKQGTKTLCVELEYIDEKGEKQFKIIRKKGPESLQYIEYKEKQREFDDDEAQVRINNFFGKNFIETSVIKQKGENCFLSSSAKDKMVFLQALLFSNSNIEKQREKVREVLKQCKDDMNNLSIKSKTLEEILKNKKVDEKDYVDKYKDFSIEECNDKIIFLEKNIVDYQECIKKIADSIQTNQREKSKYNDEEIKYKQIKSRLLIFQDQLEEVNSKINLVNTTFNQESYESLLDNITSKKNTIKYLKLKSKCESTQQVLLNQIEKSLMEIEKEENEVLIIKNKYNFDDKKYDSYCEKRDLLKKKKDNLKKLEECTYNEEELISKRQEIYDIKSYLDKAQLYKSSLSCPHCKNKVRLLNSVLEKIETESLDFSEQKIKEKKADLKVLEQDFEKLENNKKLFVHYTKELEKIQSKLDNHSDIPQEKISELSDIINKIEEIRTINKTLKKKKSDLMEEKRKVIDFTHDQLKQDYQSLQKLQKLEKLQNDENDKSVEDLEKELAKLQFVLTEQERMKNDLEVLLDKKRVITKGIKSIGSSVDECELILNKLSKLIESCVQHILQQEEQLVSVKDNNKCDKWHNKIEKLRLQKIYVEEINETKRLEREVQDINDNYKALEKSCVNYSIIAEGIDHAESMLLSRFIDTINHNLSIHLDAFFEEPMHVQIKSFKEGKDKEKPVINLEIFYKGNETDLSNLSGGEYDRLNLALTLTFNCISNSPVLILDESLASINQELSTDIIMHMKEAISSKLIWMTQHQAVKGMFDKVYSV